MRPGTHAIHASHAGSNTTRSATIRAAGVGHDLLMPRLPTLYKARGVPLKQAICAICVDRTRGKTQRIELGFGVSVWLCAAHGSREFMVENAGRDFVLTLHRLWQACGCLTGPRNRALEAHLRSLRPSPRSGRARPGSYGWPALRDEAEEAFRTGRSLDATIRRLRDRHARDYARVPSVFTMRRWHRERRWLAVSRDSPG